MTSDIIWILGAADPEMAAIETLLRECGQRVAYALDEHGARVTPGGAYRAAAYALEGEGIFTTVTPESCVTVECALASLAESGQAPRIAVDHHRHGDTGFGRPPAEFLAASSLGQVIAELALFGFYPTDGYSIYAAPEARPGTFVRGGVGGWSVVVAAKRGPAVQQFLGDRVTAAACDHCLGAAWQGQCPGVSRDDVRAYRARMAASRPIDPVPTAEYHRRFAATLQVIEDVARESREAFQAVLCSASGSEAFALAPSFVATSGVRYVDLSPWHEGTGLQECDYDPSRVIDTRACGHLDELPDVASYLGVAYLAGPTPRPGERTKVVLGGAATPQMVRDYLEVWAPAQGLVDCYGDPERGFAGGYIPK